MTSITVPTIKQRCEAIRKEISGVRAQFGVTQWEIDFMQNIENLTWGTEKQQARLAQIEIKVFGRSEYEEARAAMHRGEFQSMALAQ
jgi:hypothetical protein